MEGTELHTNSVCSFVRSFVDVVEFVCVDNTKNLVLDRWLDRWIVGTSLCDGCDKNRTDRCILVRPSESRSLDGTALSRVVVGVVIRAIRGSLCAKGALRQRGLADLCSDTRSISSKYPRRVTFLSQRAGMYQHTSQAVVVWFAVRSIDRSMHPPLLELGGVITMMLQTQNNTTVVVVVRLTPGELRRLYICTPAGCAVFCWRAPNQTGAYE